MSEIDRSLMRADELSLAMFDNLPATKDVHVTEKKKQ